MRSAIAAPASAARLTAILWLALAPALAAQTPPAAGGWGAAVAEDTAYLSSLRPHAQGSAAELRAADYVHGRLRAMGLAPELHLAAGAGSGAGLIVDAVVPGSRPDLLLVAVPLLPPAPAPGDPIAAGRRAEPAASGIGPALALGFARSLAGSPQPPPVSVRFLFLGGEHGAGAPEHGAGSRLFLQEFRAGAPVAVLYLDLRAVPSHLVPYAGGAGRESPPWLFRRVATALRHAGPPLRLAAANTVHLVRLGLTPQSLLAPFHQAGHPALYLAGRYRPVDPAHRDRWLNRMQGFFTLLLASFDDGVPAAWDRNYLLVQRPGWTLTVSEYHYVIGLLLFLALAVTCCFANSARLRYFLAPLRRGWWRLPLLAAAAYAALGAGSAVVRLLPELRGAPAPWQEAPALFAALKVTAALLTAALLRFLAGAVRLPRRHRQEIVRFHWAAAVLLLTALTGAAAASNLALAAPPAWALLCALLATVVRSRGIRFLCVLAAPAWLAGAAGGLLALPALPFVESLLFGPPAVDLAAAAVVLPFVLLGRAGVAGLRRPQRRRARARRSAAGPPGLR